MKKIMATMMAVMQVSRSILTHLRLHLSNITLLTQSLLSLSPFLHLDNEIDDICTKQKYLLVSICTEQKYLIVDICPKQKWL